VGEGFSVKPRGLEAGSQVVADLQSRCQLIAEHVVRTLAAMAGSAGHAGLVSALTAAAAKGDRAYTGMWAAYGHTSHGLAGSARAYATSDQAVAAKAGAIASLGGKATPGDQHGEPQP
jgi:hypothetical protein